MIRHQRVLTTLLAIAACFTLACADEPEPVAYSESVGLKLSGMKPKDVENNVVSEEKNVNTETGNPYGEFLKNAKDNLGGKEPSYIKLMKATVGLHSESDGLSSLGQVFTKIELFVSTSDVTKTLGTASSVSGSEVSVTIDSSVDWQALAPVMIAGDFKLGLRCETGATTPKEWEARLFMDLNFSAFE